MKSAPWVTGLNNVQLYLCAIMFEFFMYFYLKQGAAGSDQKEVFSAAPPPGSSFVIRETQLLLTLPSPLVSEACCLKMHFFFSPASPVFIFARAKQKKVPSAAESRGRKRKRSPQTRTRTMMSMPGKKNKKKKKKLFHACMRTCVGASRGGR